MLLAAYRQPGQQKKDLEQWYIKITDYADRLLADLDGIDWPEPIKLMQRNWIRSQRRRGTRLSGRWHTGKAVRFSHASRPPSSAYRSWCSRRASAGRRDNDSVRAREGRELCRPTARRQTEIERMSNGQGKIRRFTGALRAQLFTR